MKERRSLFQLEETLGEDWENLRQAEDSTLNFLDDLSPKIQDATTADVAFVVFGSAARREITSGSDLDWTLLIDGLSDPAHFESALEIEKRLIGAQLKLPGAEETFGGLAFSHELLHRIGGADDTNRNTTQRMLLLLESDAVGTRDAYDRVVRNVLLRYITEDWGWMHGRGPAHVPRFLQNDLARYWRTVAVDFAYKRRDRGRKGWALRTIKLRLSRKLMYASGLLACFSCDLENVLKNGSTETEPAASIVEHLQERFAFAPLDIVAEAVLRSGVLDDAARDLFGAYDGFLAILNDGDKRSHLEKLEPDESSNDRVYEEAREQAHRFQAGLDGVFFGNDVRIAELTRIYGVF